MAQEITDKEHTWLVLKWGDNCYIRLANIDDFSWFSLNSLERRAAKVGLQLLAQRSKEVCRRLAEEIDDEILKTVNYRSSDENN